MTKSSTYRDEFPNYAPETLPAIPSDWEDSSWHNEVCPSWMTPSGLQVYVDYEDPAQREIDDAPRFSVICSNEQGVADVYSGDDWAEVLAAVKEWKPN